MIRGRGRFLLSIVVMLFMTRIALAQGGSNRERPGSGGRSSDFYNISGIVQDESTAERLSFATVRVINTLDSSMVKGTVTDMEGIFKLAVRPGKYLLETQFVTYDKLYQEVEVKRGEKLDVGTIQLTSTSLELEGVTVEAERTQMQLNLDKKVFNVGKDISNLGGTVSDILDNLPSVTVDVEGNVELRGSANVQILIDGKPSGLVGLSSADALRQLQANLVERIEIITNPSARYDAAGVAGIINVVLKKEKKQGVNGSFQANTGAPHNHGLSGNVNFRKSWVNLFLNYGLNYRKAPGGGNSLQQFTFPDTTYTTSLNRSQKRGGLSDNIRFGADFYLTDNDILTTSFLYRYSDEKNNALLTFDDFDSEGNFISTTTREDDETEGDHNLEYSINYTKNFKRKDHKLTADIQFQDNNETEKSDIEQNQTILGDAPVELPQLFQRVRNSEGEKRLMLQADYVQPFGKKGKFEVGYRSTLRDIKNNYNVWDVDFNGDLIPIDTFTNDFAYDENVHAAYSIVSNEFGRLSWQAGLRVENTDIDSRFEEEDRSLSWNYTNLFPSAFMTYKLTDIQQFQLSYSRRIKRPRFRELNPFSSFTDNRNFRLGNPELQPEFTDSYEVGILQNVQNATIYYGLYYRRTTQLIQRITLAPDENGVRVRVPENIGSSDDFGIDINASKEFGKWYRVSGNVNFFRSEVSGMLGDSINLAATATSFTTRLSNNFKLKDLFDAQININYRAPRETTQGRRLAITVIDVGMSRDVLGKNGTISLSVRDLFNTRKWRSITELDNFYEESEFQWRRGPNAVVTFIYRLNQKKSRSRGRRGRDGGGFEEGF